MNSLHKIVSSIFLVFALLFATPTLSFATQYMAIPGTSGVVEIPDNEDIENSNKPDPEIKSLQKEYFMGILYKTISNGALPMFDISGEKTKEREKINFEIMNGNAADSYSLFDRFGSDLTFPLYLGEEKTKTGAIDKVYSLMIDNAEGELDFKRAADLLAKKDSTYENRFYSQRPELKGKGADPRCDTYQTTNLPATLILGWSNYLLTSSIILTDFTNMVVSDELIDFAIGFPTFIFESKTWEASKSILLCISGILTVGLLFFIIKKCLEVVKGDFSMQKFIIDVLGSLLSLGLLLCMINFPMKVVEISKTIITFGDNITSEVIKFANEGNPIVSSSSNKNVLHAAIWQTSVFEPWVEGTFNRKYNELYTYNASEEDLKDGGKKIEQGVDASIATGDISVPLGSGKSVKNWAALAYSCSSVYHLDALGKYNSTETNPSQYEWPKTERVDDNSIYNDDFRWVDAMLGVGQTYNGTKEQTASYVKDKEKPEDDPNNKLDSYVFNGFFAGLQSFWRGLLLLPLIYIGIRKLLAILMCLFNVFIILYRSLINVLFPGKEGYSIISNIKSSYKPFVSYFWYLLLILVDILLYNALVSQGMMQQLFYLVLSLYFCFTTPDNLKGQFDEAKKIALNTFTNAKNQIGEWKNTDYRSVKATSLGVGDNENHDNEEDKEDRKKEEEIENNKYSKNFWKNKFGSSSNSDVRTVEWFIEAYNKLKQSAEISKYNRPDYRTEINDLIADVNSTMKNKDKAVIINKFRCKKYKYGENSFVEYREIDYECGNSSGEFRIEKEFFADVEDNSYGTASSFQRKDVTFKNSAKNGGDYSKTREQLDANLEKYKTSIYSNSNLSDSTKEQKIEKMKKKMLKEMNKERKKIKYDSMQRILNNATGNLSGGSLIPPIWKVYILGGIVGLYLIMFILSGLFGSLL